MTALKFIWPISLVVGAAVVAWKAALGEFVGMDLFPLVFAVVVVVAVLADLLIVRTAPRRAKVLLGALAVSLACFGAVAHHRVLAQRRAAAEQRGMERWLGRQLSEVSFDHGWNPPADASTLEIDSFPTTLWLEDGVVKGYQVGIDGTLELLQQLDL